MRRSAGVVRGVLAAAVLVAACGDGSGPAGVIPGELVGTWAADATCVPSCGFTLSSLESPPDTLNATQMLGLSTEVEMRSDGRFTLTFRPGSGSSTGSVRVAGSMLIVTDAGGAVDTLDYTVTPTVLDVRFRRIFEGAFDFTGDGVADPARARGVFVRR